MSASVGAVVWSGASRQLLCGTLDRDYAAMVGEGWDLIYVPPSPLTTPWHGLSDWDLRRLYNDEWTRSTRITVGRNMGAGRPMRHRPPKETGLMMLVLAAVAQSPRAMSLDELLRAVQAAGFQAGRQPVRQRLRDELSRLVKTGRLRCVARGQYCAP